MDGGVLSRLDDDPRLPKKWGKFTSVNDPTAGSHNLDNLTKPRGHRGRSNAGFNPAGGEEVRWFAPELASDHIVQGFRNRDIRAGLLTGSRNDSLRQRRHAAIGRLL